MRRVEVCGSSSIHLIHSGITISPSRGWVLTHLEAGLEQSLTC